MQLADLIQLFRAEVDDLEEPFLWSDEEVIEFANDAQLEACRRARLLVDSSTSDICQLAVTAASNGLVELDPRLLFVRQVRFAGKLPMRRMNMQDMAAFNPFWQDAPASVPYLFVTDYETGKVLFWPKPAADMTALATVVRDPLAEMNDGQDTPEISARHHRSLRFWMMFRAYSKQDAEANDPKKAADSLVLFEQEFGRKSSAIDEAWITREQMEGDGTF
jgi:hypothetical protein